MPDRTAKFAEVDRLVGWVPFGDGDEAAGEVSWIEHSGDGGTAVGVWRVQPSDLPEDAEVVMPTDETVYGLAGRARLTLDDGRTVDLAPGVVVFLPAGSVSRWTILEPFTELFVSSMAA